MRMRSAISVAVLAVLVAACNDRSEPTSPSSAPSLSPSFAISDGAHSGGNPNFFFLPPLQPSPRRSPNFDRGKFNPNLSPTVKICDGRDLTPQGECASPLLKSGQPVVFTAVRGWDGLPDWVDPEQYHVLWQTRSYNLVLGHPYRIVVKVGGTLLGFLDIVPSSRLLSALRITAGGQDVGWLQNTIVPIRFRIEQGALCANPQDCLEVKVSSAGGDFTLPTKYAGLSVPAGAVKSGDTVTIVIEKESPQYDGQCLPTDLSQSTGCYHFRSEPPLYQFAPDVRLEACVDVEHLTPEQREQLLLYKYNQTQGLQALPRVAPTLIDCTGFIAMAHPAASRPSNLAAAVLQRLGDWAGRLLAPKPLYAAWFAGVPKGIGGSGGSFSDVGGAVPNVPEGVVSWWPADRDFADLYGGNHATPYGNVSIAGGIRDSAWYFAGDGAYAQAPGVGIDTLNQLSIELWVRLDALPSAIQRFVTIAPPTIETAVLRQDGTNSQDPNQLHFYMSIDGSFRDIRVTGLLQTGCFEHVVGTYDGQSMRLYLNGAEIGALNHSGVVDHGHGVRFSSPDEPLTGALDEVRIFNRALTASEVAADYAAVSSAGKCAPVAGLLPADVTSALAAAVRIVGPDTGNIYRLDPGATSWTEVTNVGHSASNDRDRAPAWFPNGQVLAFVKNHNIYTMNSDGTGLHQLTTAGTDDYPAVSPLGTSIAFVRTAGREMDIWVMNSDGTNATNLTNHPAGYLKPAWSPDGSRIAFGSTLNGAGDIYLINADGTNLQRLTYISSSFEPMRSPAWSPAGDRIAYEYSHETSGTRIRVMNPDGSDALEITHGSTFDVEPVWSPDGNWIAFTRAPSYAQSHADPPITPTDVYLARPDGSEERQVTYGTYGQVEYGEPSWPLPYYQPALMPDQIVPLKDPINFGSSYCYDPIEHTMVGLGSLFQSFTPTATSLVAVNLYLYGSVPEEGYTTSILVHKDTPSGTVIGTASNFVASSGQTDVKTDVRFQFSPPLSLVPGNTYVIEWVSPPEPTVTLGWVGYQDVTYAGGTAFGCYATPIPGDYVFTTWW
jgi:Tol biopolymer transport system component